MSNESKREKDNRKESVSRALCSAQPPRGKVEIVSERRSWMTRKSMIIDVKLATSSQREAPPHSGELAEELFESSYISVPYVKLTLARMSLAVIQVAAIGVRTAGSKRVTG